MALPLSLLMPHWLEWRQMKVFVEAWNIYTQLQPRVSIDVRMVVTTSHCASEKMAKCD
ncbi:hypothetical protein QNS27_004996 [Vibrio parahaemolyticus]|nr:hypothetical protein [Vibrio parahaemolyticus]